jgi:hypothetical protein
VVLVAFMLPVANDRAGFVNLVEGIHVRALTAHTTLEEFNVPVAPGLTRWNVLNFKLANSEFVEGVGSEL